MINRDLIESRALDIFGAGKAPSLSDARKFAAQQLEREQNSRERVNREKPVAVVVAASLFIQEHDLTLTTARDLVPPEFASRGQRIFEADLLRMCHASGVDPRQVFSQLADLSSEDRHLITQNFESNG